jgi:TPR repeat protein
MKTDEINSDVQMSKERQKKKVDEAKSFLERAVEFDHSESCVQLGQIYENGWANNDSASNNTIAVEWYRKAAEAGYAKGENKYGFMLYTGRGVTRDFRLDESTYVVAFPSNFIIFIEKLFNGFLGQLHKEMPMRITI